MKILSWNINGLPSCLKSGALEPLLAYQPDAVCLQEIRTRTEPVVLEGYKHYWHHSMRDKYSGTVVLLQKEPLSVHYGLTMILMIQKAELLQWSWRTSFC